MPVTAPLASATVGVGGHLVADDEPLEAPDVPLLAARPAHDRDAGVDGHQIGHRGDEGADVLGRLLVEHVDEEACRAREHHEHRDSERDRDPLLRRRRRLRAGEGLDLGEIRSFDPVRDIEAIAPGDDDSPAHGVTALAPTSKRTTASF